MLLEAPIGTRPVSAARRRALGMTTEASYRFERGIDRWAGGDAMRRCIELVLATGGGRLADAPLDLWPEPSHPPRIFLRPARVAQVLGVEVPWNAIEQYLVAIGATVVSKPDDGRIAVDVPGWRPDLVREIDLIEEIARLHGYDNFPSDLRPFRLGTLPDALRGEGHVRGPPRHGGAGSLRGLPPPPRPGRWRRERPPAEPALRRRCLAAPAPAPWSRAPRRGQLGQPRRATSACSRSAPSWSAGRPGEPPWRGATGRGRLHRPPRAARTGRAPGRSRLRPVGPEGPLRGRGRSGDSRRGGAS